MKFLARLALCVLVGAAPAQAACTVFFGDSIFDFYRPQSIPDLVGVLQPGMGICNGGRPGRTTAQGITDIDATMSYVRVYHRLEVSDVVILLGINDHKTGVDPYQTALNLRTIARKARAWGNPRVWILTLLPATRIPFSTAPDPMGFGRDVSNWLYQLDGEDPITGVYIIDARDKYLTTLWSSCSSDGVHPTAIACRWPAAQAIAAELASNP